MTEHGERKMIDHENEVIFIHIPRTGGTSIEKALIGEDFWKIDHRNKHATCHTAKKEYAEYWDDYFKFSFVRNPWDRHVSMLKHEEYFYGKSDTLGQGNLSIDKLLHYTTKYGSPPDTIEFDYRFVERNFFDKFDLIPQAVYTNYVGPEMDFIGRFENLQNDFDIVTKMLGLEQRELPNSGASKERTHYSDYYDDKSQTLIKSIYDFDIKRFDYSFEDM